MRRGAKSRNGWKIVSHESLACLPRPISANMKPSALILFSIFGLIAPASALEPVTFNARTARSGLWSEPQTWEEGRLPKAGDFVQIRAGHTVTYDVDSSDAIRMLHVAGTLRFSKAKNTQLDIGLIKVEPGETMTEDGFDCHDEGPALPAGGPRPVLEIGTAESPIPAGITATVRLRYFEGTDPQTLPAIVVCGGRWDVHGTPMRRTWLKLGAPAKPGDTQVTLEEPVSDWQVGDHVIVTVAQPSERLGTFRQDRRDSMPAGTEDRMISAVNGAVLTLDRALNAKHSGEGMTRCEVANLSRNVVVESADPAGVRGHTMYHRESSGSISYAEFRHLGKDGVLGKYAIHFHLVRDTMRGSGVLGASVWDSHNRWITIHGTDHLLVRDCVGYQSRGHGFFLEDGTEQWNIFDRNLAVQAYHAKPLPKQVLSFDSNDGAGFWWANGRNAFTRNVSCENDRYGYHFELAKTSNFDPTLRMRNAKGEAGETDVRTLPFLRFENNESHSEGLYSFKFGDERKDSVHGDREHPFIVRDLRAWDTHYVLRPNLKFFLVEGLRIKDSVYGVYAPDYDAHVYRDVSMDNVNAEPVNRGHDDESFQNGDFTYDRLTLANCKVGRDPLIQLTCTAPRPGVSGHFRALTIANSTSHEGKVVDLGGGPRNKKLENPVIYYFHDTPEAGTVTEVVSAKFPEAIRDPGFHTIENWTGRDVRAAEVKDVPFPELLSPVDDLPPATLITGVRRVDGRLVVRGVAEDNGEVATVRVNGQTAQIICQQAGIADWEITLDLPADGHLIAISTDRAGNVERMPHPLGPGERTLTDRQGLTCLAADTRPRLVLHRDAKRRSRPTDRTLSLDDGRTAPQSCARPARIRLRDGTGRHPTPKSRSKLRGR